MRTYIDTLREHPLVFDEAVHTLGHIFPRLLELEHTEQDPTWHAEGDVATHTRMVLEELEAWLAAPTAQVTNVQALRLGALLHDIAKSFTTTRRMLGGVERVVAPRHAELGASHVSSLLIDPALGLSGATRDRIRELVRRHHDPKFLVLKDHGAHRYRRLSRRVDLEEVYALELADMRGRRCEDQDEQLEYLELFRLGCEEAGVWGSATPIAEFVHRVAAALRDESVEVRERAIMEGLWDWDAGNIYTPEEAVARSFAARKRRVALVTTFGLSASGKSTWLREAYPNYAFISMDDIRAEFTGDPADQSKNDHVLVEARKRLKQCLREERDVVWDATNLRRDFRAAVLQTARRYSAHTTLVILETSYDECARRNADRERQLPPQILARQLDAVQYPDLDEAHRVIWVEADGTVRRDQRAWWIKYASGGD